MGVPTKGWSRKTSIAGIYKILSPSGRVYIGQSWDIINRWRLHKSIHAKGCLLVNSSFLKHGSDAHDFSIIHTLPLDVSQEVMNEYEILYLNQYRSAGVRMLNLRDGGGNAKPSEETRRKMSLALKGKKHKFKEGRTSWNKGLKGIMVAWNKGIKGVYKASEETKKRLSISLMGKQNALGTIRPLSAIISTTEKNRGKKRTDEQRKAISKACVGRPYHGKNNGKVRSEAVRKLHSEIQTARIDNKGEFHNMAKLTNIQVIEIRSKYRPREYSLSKLASEYNISKRVVLDIVHYKLWKHI